MSHVVSLRVEIKNKQALKAAVERLGGTLTEGVEKFTWWGTHMGDYPLPTGFTAADMGKCHHKISFPNVRYEIGLVEIDKLPADHPARHAVDKDGKRIYSDGSLVPMFDFIDINLVNAVGGRGAERLVQLYRVEQFKQAARKKGHTKFKETTDAATGKIQLEITTG